MPPVPPTPRPSPRRRQPMFRSLSVPTVGNKYDGGQYHFCFRRTSLHHHHARATSNCGRWDHEYFVHRSEFRDGGRRYRRYDRTYHLSGRCDRCRRGQLHQSTCVSRFRARGIDPICRLGECRWSLNKKPSHRDGLQIMPAPYPLASRLRWKRPCPESAQVTMMVAGSLHGPWPMVLTAAARNPGVFPPLQP